MKPIPLLLAAAVLGSCKQANREAESEGGQAQSAESTAAAPLPPDVARAVEIARAVQANPAAADSILTAHRLTRAGLDSLVYAIAADSAKAAAYSAALR